MLFKGQFRPPSAGFWAKQAPLFWQFFKVSWPAVQKDQSIKDPHRYKLGNGASGHSEDSSPLEGASSPPLSEADPHHSWSPGTASATRRVRNRGQGQGQERHEMAEGISLPMERVGRGSVWGSDNTSSQVSGSLISDYFLKES